MKTQKSKLVKLDLSNNFLQHLSKAYFKNMPDLQILRLHGNKINYLTQEPGLFGFFSLAAIGKNSLETIENESLMNV